MATEQWHSSGCCRSSSSGGSSSLVVLVATTATLVVVVVVLRLLLLPATRQGLTRTDWSSGRCRPPLGQDQGVAHGLVLGAPSGCPLSKRNIIFTKAATQEQQPHA